MKILPLEAEGTFFYTAQLTNSRQNILLSQINSILVPLNNALYFTNLSWINYYIVENVVCKWSKKKSLYVLEIALNTKVTGSFISNIKFNMYFANHFVKVIDCYWQE